MRFIVSALTVLSIVLLAGCEKEEQPLQLPVSEVFAGSITDRVDMGADYATQSFYSLSTQKVVQSGPCDNWDLAFESSADGVRVFMNGGAREGGTKGNIAVYKTGFQHFANVTGLPPGFHSGLWRYDDPSGNRDSTGVGEWRNLSAGGVSKEDVYIVRTGTSGGGRATHKMQILSATARKWTVAVGVLGATEPIVLDLPKDTTRNFIYYSLHEGVVAGAEPPKAAWDVLFTRYRYLYRELNNFPYTVTGVLINPDGVSVAVDSVSLWENIEAAHAGTLTYTTARDAIGWNWKTIGTVNGQPGGNYTVDSRRTYVVRARSGRLYKLRFLDFYSPTGEKGSPTFEYKQLK